MLRASQVHAESQGSRAPIYYCGDSVLWCITSLHSRVSLMLARFLAELHLPGMLFNSAPKAMATFHMELMSLWLFSSKIGLIQPQCHWACCSLHGTQGLTQVSAPTGAVGEHLSFKSWWRCGLFAGLDPTTPCPAGMGLGISSEQTWALIKCSCSLFQSLILWNNYFLFNGTIQLCPLYGNFEAELKRQAVRAELGLCFKGI